MSKLAHRIRISAVFDPVAVRAEQIAEEHGACAVQGVSSLVQRADVDAVLLLDSAWHGAEALRLLCAAGKPVYIAAEFDSDVSTLRALHWTAVSYGLTLMPELGRRYTPATSRLQELMATRLGPAQRIRFEAVVPSRGGPERPWDSVAGNLDLVGLFDWCRYILKAPPTRAALLQRTHPPAADAGDVVRIDYQPATPGKPERHVELAIRRESAEANTDTQQSGTVTRCEVTCENGLAVLESAEVIRWQQESPIVETLSSDRNEVEVMLDHFCRRVVGGLIPVADLADVYRGIQLAAAVTESSQTGRAVLLNGRH